MAVYLIHFDRPIGDPGNPRGQARHYIGYADDLERRLAQHRSGNGSALMAAVARVGIPWQVVRTWPDGGPDAGTAVEAAEARLAVLPPLSGGKEGQWPISRSRPI
jgi:hypothetical protein